MEQYVYIHEYADTYFMGQGNGEGGDKMGRGANRLLGLSCIRPCNLDGVEQ